MPSRTELWRLTGRDPVQVIRELAQDGYGAAVIGDIVGVSRPTVKAWAAMFGIELPKRTAREKQRCRPPSAYAIKRAAEHNSRWVEWSGGRERLLDAAARLGITSDALSQRIKRWGVELAMTEPKRRPFHGVHGRKLSDNHPWMESVVPVERQNRR